MALVNCLNCGESISDAASKCPHCGKKLKKNNVILPAVMVLVVVCCVAAFWGWGQYQKLQEQKRQEQIAQLLLQAEEHYTVFDFEAVGKCYDELEKINYDMSKQRDILEYDKEVYPDAYAYYEAINDFEDALTSNSYSSLRRLINTLKTPTRKFNSLEINTESRIGQYISNVRTNIMYTTFNSEFVNSMEYDVDYYLTSWGYEMLIESYVEEILEEEFPYIEK